MKTFLQVGLLSAVVGLAVTGAAQAPNSTSASFSIKISTSQDVVKVGSEVSLAIRMRNISNQEIYYAWGAGPVFDVQIHDRDGKSAPETELGLRIHGKDPRFAQQDSFHEPVILRTLGPEKDYDETFSLNRFYDLNEPGKYTVQVQRLDLRSKILVKSNAISLTVTP